MFVEALFATAYIHGAPRQNGECIGYVCVRVRVCARVCVCSFCLGSDGPGQALRGEAPSLHSEGECIYVDIFPFPALLAFRSVSANGLRPPPPSSLFRSLSLSLSGMAAPQLGTVPQLWRCAPHA